MEKDRKMCLERILESNAKHKLIIAGAGTGKSFTFKCLLKKNGGSNLALTFINALASDMAKDLGELAEARTFHSFCRKLLHKLPPDGVDHQFHFFPKLKLMNMLSYSHSRKSYKHLGIFCLLTFT